MAPTPRASERLPAADALLDTLRHPIRRAAIQYFERLGRREAALDELVAHVTEVCRSESPDEVRIQLVHSHLPKLADREWLEYDTETWDIRYHGHETAEQVLDDVRTMF